MPRATSKLIDPAARWADLLQAEINQRGTLFPVGAKTISEITEMRKKAGLPCGIRSVREFLSESTRIGTIKRIDGSELKNGRLVNAARYIAIDGV